MKSSGDGFLAAQRAFSAYLRDPENEPKPEGLNDQRLAVYQNAVFANVEQFLADNFPRVKEFFADESWGQLVRDYIVRHKSTTACFVELPLEFLNYLENTRDENSDPEFLYELAHFEWVETLVGADVNEFKQHGIATEGDLLAQSPVLNPLVRLIKYNYPVHRLSPELPLSAMPEEPTYIAAYRKLDHKFSFLDLNAATARMIELLAENQGASGQELIQHIAEEMGLADATSIFSGAVEILERLRESEVIVGVVSPPSA